MIKFDIELAEGLTVEEMIKDAEADARRLREITEALIVIHREYPDAVVRRGPPGVLAFDSKTVHPDTDKIDIEALSAAWSAKSRDVRSLFYREFRGVRVYSSALINVANAMATITAGQSLLDRYKMVSVTP